MSYDLIIRNAKIVDGSGRPAHGGDIAVRDGLIAAIGTVDGNGRREIDADGRLVTPGYVDIHTHYDGQATWDAELAPSSWHGVTTVVTGNCGVGFAPVKPRDRDRLIELMEGVEDIPGAALHEGLPWEWESFEEYMDFLDGQPRDIDLGVQVPHAPVRLNVMGERCANGEPATPDDITDMRLIVERGLAAGALGFTTSRTINHKDVHGELTPTLAAEFDELAGIADALSNSRTGTFQLVSDFRDVAQEFQLLRGVAERANRPMSISVTQSPLAPDDHLQILDLMHSATLDGTPMYAQVAARAVGLILSLEGTLHPFMHAQTWAALDGLSIEQRRQELLLPEVQRRLIEEATVDRSDPRIGARLIGKYELMFPFNGRPPYEPDAGTSIADEAARRGQHPAEVALEVLLHDDGRGMMYMPAMNFVDGRIEGVRRQLEHPSSVVGLSDGGAHVGTICDMSFPTTLLEWWGRDRPTGRLPVELLVHKQTLATARLVGLNDRGLIEVGRRADINVIDFERLAALQPRFRYDLPGGKPRLVQAAQGYDHTFVAGEEVRQQDEPTGARPGRLVRGARAANGAD